VLHQVGVSFDLYYDARKHKIKIYLNVLTHGYLMFPSTARLATLIQLTTPSLLAESESGCD
jgi:hypothetical protein